MGLDNGMAKGNYTPSGYVTLVKNEDVVPDRGSFNYSSAVGILICLSVHTLPDITFAVNFCARYMD